MKRYKTQIVVFGASILLVVLFSFAKTKPLAQKKPMASSSSHVHAIKVEDLMKSAPELLDEQELTTFQILEKELIATVGGADRVAVTEKLVNFWKAQDAPVPVAYYAEMKAESSKKKEDWSDAGDYYYKATWRVTSPDVKAGLVHKAQDCYEQVLKLDPKDEHARLGLGSCLVQGSDEPMKGIKMIREVLTENPKNTEAMIRLGEFHIMRANYDGAIQMFNDALTTDPSLYFLYAKIAEAYLDKGDKSNAIHYYEKYGEFVKDPFQKTSLENYINKLKKQ